MTTIFIVSEYNLFGEGLKSLISQEENFEIIGQAIDFEIAISRIKKSNPDVVILDNTDGELEKGSTQAIGPILYASPQTRIIGLNMQDSNLYVYQARRWVTKDISDLIRAIRTAFISDD